MADEEFKPDRPVEVTDQMVEAGARVVEDFHTYGLPAGLAEDLARAVYAAMRHAETLRPC